MSRYRVFSPARGDLQEIIRYVSANRPLVAKNLSQKFRKAFERLGDWPGTGHRRSDLGEDSNLRFWRMESYLIVYKNHPAKGVCILRILHGSRDIAGLLRDEPPDDE